MASPVVTSPMLDVLALLMVAWEEKEDVYGWLIMERTRRSGPTIYHALDALEDRGWITGSWESLPAGEKRARRRLYRLTGAGVRAAREHCPIRLPDAKRVRPRVALGFGGT